MVELCRPETFLDRFEWQGQGCPRKWRLPILLGFIAKAVWNFPTTRALLDRLAHDATLRRLCGWERAGEIPSEATFSRAFAEFAASELPQQIHEVLITEHLGEKLVGHISRDATAIVGREKPAAKQKPAAKPAKPKCQTGSAQKRRDPAAAARADAAGAPGRAHAGGESGRAAAPLRRGGQAQQPRVTPNTGSATSCTWTWPTATSRWPRS